MSNSIKKVQIPFFVLVGLLFILNACYEKPEFPVVPQIGFNSISASAGQDPNTLSPTDVVTITIDFQDGDGDLGLNETDTLPPYQKENEDGSPNEFNKNYILDVFLEQNGEFIPYPLPNPEFNFNGRYQRLNVEGRKTPLEGIINHKVIFQRNLTQPNTLLKFRVQILDRALNRSNVIETDTIRINIR